jgi:hypothetical protein
MQTRLTFVGEGQSATRATFRSIHGDNGSANLFPRDETRLKLVS